MTKKTTSISELNNSANKNKKGATSKKTAKAKRELQINDIVRESGDDREMEIISITGEIAECKFGEQVEIFNVRELVLVKAGNKQEKGLVHKPEIQEPEAEEAAPPVKKHTKQLNLPYIFTPEEKIMLSRELADKYRELESLEDKKKSIASQIKADLDEIKATTNKVVLKIEQGMENRTVLCEITYDFPHPDIKTILRTDTNESWQEQMATADYSLFPN